MGIPVKLEAFEGPLDLLLHLIEKNKVDIYDIPIVEITNQYMEYIREMQEKDLNIMSEFLLMAATLLDIKCRMLLPAEVNEDGEVKKADMFYKQTIKAKTKLTLTAFVKTGLVKTLIKLSKPTYNKVLVA